MVLNCLKNVETCVISRDFANEENNSEETECGSSSVKEKPIVLEYDPHDYGKEHHPTFFWGTVIHLLKTVVGTGILALPYTFKSVGYGVAILGSLMIGYLYVHVLHMLVEVEYHLSKSLKVPNLTYLGVVQHSFEQGPRVFKKVTPIAKFLVYFHYVFNKSLSNTVYLITIGGNFKMIIDYYYDTDLNLVAIMSVIIIPLLILCCIRNLKFLVPLSMLTNAFNVVCIILILAASTSYDGSADLKPVTDITAFPSFFGVVLGALHATGIVLPLKNDMKNPKRFSTTFGVLNIALTIATLAYSVFGFLAYAKYGNQLQPNVLHNLPAGSLVSQFVISLYSIALFISFTLMAYIGFDTLWSNIFVNKKLKYPSLTEYAIRISVVVMPYLTAVLLPDFRIMVMTSSLVGIIMDEAVPPILHILMLMKMKDRSARMYMIVLKDIGLIIISLFLFVAAVINVIQNIIEFYSNSSTQ